MPNPSVIPNRPYYFPGVGYPEDKTELLEVLDYLTGQTKGLKLDSQAPRASIFPHIDFYRCPGPYAAGYQELHGLAAPGKEPLTVVILGISHKESRTPYILTKAHFETPIGLVKTDRKLVDTLAKNLPFDPYLEEANHLDEHSVELQTLLLQHLLKDRREFRIVPVLCYNFAIQGRYSPLEIPGVPEFLENLKQLFKTTSDVHVLASVDLSHMGLEYGGEQLTPEFLEELKGRDLESLAAVESGDADAYFATHQKDGGERNNCGIPAIYTLLKLFPECFELHSYEQSTRSHLGSTVTVCSGSLK